MSERGAKRPRDEIWDTLTEHFGEVRTKSERGRRNKAVRELREAGATVEELRTVIDYCQRNFTVYTEIACVTWFSRALHEQQLNSHASNILELIRRANGERT